MRSYQTAKLAVTTWIYGLARRWDGIQRPGGRAASVPDCGWLVGQRSGEAEAGQGAGVVEAGEGGDLVALEGEDEQPGGVRDRGVLVAQV